MSKFNQRFRELKEESDYTLKALSEKIEISAPNLSYYMNNREPNYDILCRIADFFEVTTDYLVGRSNQRNFETEGFVNELRKAANTPLKNENRSELIEKAVVDFYRYLVAMANAETEDEDFEDLWESVSTLLNAIKYYGIYMESLSSDPYPIDNAKIIMDTLTLARKNVFRRISTMLGNIITSAPGEVPQEIKDRVIVKSSFGIKSANEKGASEDD